MKTDWLGDCALIVRELPAPAHEIAAWLQANRPRGVAEVVASYGALGVYLESSDFEPEMIVEALSRYEPPELLVPNRHEIPVCYELGEDLIEAAKRLGLSPLELVHLHCGQTYTCYAVGFSPGFPYLGYLPEQLAGLPRRHEPRVKVPAGSVAITGSQTGVYPTERPGGWHLVGRTPLTIVDVASGFFPISAGDEIKFVPIPLHEFETLAGSRL